MEALVIVDLQNDFMPGGPLGVTGGDQVASVINKLQPAFDCIVAVQDWHPQDHVSFATTHGKEPGEMIEVEGILQTLWPPHCVQNTRGAEFVQEFDQSRVQKVFKKGSDRLIDSYGGFFDNKRCRETGLEEFLRDHKIQHIYLVGLATDYCVKYTALDGVMMGFNVTVIVDACRAVDLNPTDEQEALEEMRSAGVRLLTAKQVLAERKVML